jgi:bifunctional DNA-binding transcriptional regulator/antitoxin component of YhaV-PrlF toxin-antitoxin module
MIHETLHFQAPCLYLSSMNARTQVSPGGAVHIPEEVLGRLSWAPGTPLELVETPDGIALRVAMSASPFGHRDLADLQALPPLAAEPQSIERISRLSDEDIRRLAG